MISRIIRMAVAVLLLGAVYARAEAVTNLWFPIGESLEYTVYWGMIPVGHSITTNELVEENGKTCLAIRIRSTTTDFLSKLYPVDDFLETIIDLDTFLPIRFTKKLSEGRYQTHEITTFDHANLKAHWYRIKDKKEHWIDIQPDTRDLISFMFHMRKQGVDTRKKSAFKVLADEKIYDLFVHPDDYEEFRVGDYGWLKCLKLEPEGSFGGVFVRKGRMWMWVSTDPRRLATKIAAKIPVASINIRLNKVRGPGDDFWVKGNMKEEGSSDDDQE